MKPTTDKHSKMPRLFVVFRTFDRIWDSAMYTRELAHLDMDTSSGGIQFIFQIDHVANFPHRDINNENNNCLHDQNFYLQPHRGHPPIFIGHQSQSIFLTRNNDRKMCSKKSACCQSLSLFSNSEKCRSMPDNIFSDCGACGDKAGKEYGDVSYFILPMRRCTVVVDANFAARINNMYRRSRTFRRRFFHKIRKTSGFRDCTPEYEKWSQKERDTWDNYLSIPFMLDVIAVWPWQKVDYTWCDRTLSLLNKHVMLEESLAWLSTLGGAHSSLGETFMDHAERAGEISCHQLRLARELGNEVIIARCYLYWAWSLLQRDYLTKCKICIINTWKYVQKIKCSDKILTNMCRAVWSRLQYKRSLVGRLRVKCSSPPRDSGHKDTDGPGCGTQCKDNSSDYNESIINTSGMRMQSVQVC